MPRLEARPLTPEKASQRAAMFENSYAWLVEALGREPGVILDDYVDD